MKKIGVCLGLVLAFHTVKAQKYITAAGVRISQDQIGLTIQQRTFPKTTIEGIGSVGSREYSGTVLIEQHFPIISKGLNYYLGGGGHIGKIKDRGTFYGGDLILGAEFKIPFLPVTISGDLKPAFHTNHDDWFNLGSGFSLRAILIKEKKKKFKLFGNSTDDDDDSGGIFGSKKKTKSKTKSGWFGSNKEEEKEETKFKLFKKKEEPEEKKKFNLFGN
jgi:hypothetical protein